MPCSILASMEDRPRRKRAHLSDAGVLNAHPARVDDPLFHDHPTFFDANDQLQVRYEMLRSHRVDDQSVVAICQRYGVSRQSFYNVQERFDVEGTVGLLPRKPGPKGPSKLTAEVLQFIARELQDDPDRNVRSLVTELEGRFGVRVHKRTLEKLLAERRSKKNS
ncbi:MAG: helix-turn-helix domain-containing protein [Hyphomicrobium sp.]